jgi:hypothetical protein
LDSAQAGAWLRMKSRNTAPRVTVVGLRFGQEAHITRRCGRDVNLRFVPADQAQPRLPACDAVFLLTKFIKHYWTEAAYRTFPRDQVHLHHGGISDLVKKIKVLAGPRSATTRTTP